MVTIRREMRVGPKNFASLIHLHGQRAHEDASLRIRGALAFFRGASCSVKFREPISYNLITSRCNVNAGNKIKRIFSLGTIRSE
jgi:hypothetical protein